MERKQLEYFLAIAAHGSFTSAAGSLHVSQPSLSYAIRGLEKEIGAPLFRRLGRGVALTPAGEALLPSARRVIQAFARFHTEAQRITQVVSGRLDIMTVTTLAVDPLAPLVGVPRAPSRRRTEHRRPENAAAVVSAVRNGECELGLTEHGIAAEGMVVLDLPEQELYAVLPPRTELKPPGPITARQLAALDIVTTPPGTTTRSAVDNVLASAGDHPGRGRGDPPSRHRAAGPRRRGRHPVTEPPRPRCRQPGSGHRTVEPTGDPARRPGFPAHPALPRGTSVRRAVKEWESPARMPRDHNL